MNVRTVQYLVTNAMIAAHETAGNLVVPWCIQLLAVASNYSSQEKTWLNTISRLPLCSKIHSFPLNSTPDHQFWSHAQCVSEELETCCILPKWLRSNTMVQWCRGLWSFVSWILHWIIFLAQKWLSCYKGCFVLKRKCCLVDCIPHTICILSTGMWGYRLYIAVVGTHIISLIYLISNNQLSLQTFQSSQELSWQPFSVS